MVRLFSLVLFFYVDDVFMADLRSSASQAKRTFRKVAELIGWSLDPEKSEGMCECIKVLGCAATVVPQGLKWRLADRKSQEWTEQLEGCLREGRLSSGVASKVAGRLNFAMSRVFGRIGRAWIRPLLWRQRRLTSASFNGRLRSALCWWAKLLAMRPARLLRRDSNVSSTADVLVYADAEGSGGVCVYFYWCGYGRREYAAGAVPKRWKACIKYRKTQINMFELLAVLAAWETWAADLAGLRVSCFIDNTSALDIVLSGWSKHEDLNWVAGKCWLSIASARSTVAWSWVASKKNPADAPSRGALTGLGEAQRRALRWPRPPSKWIVQSPCDELPLLS